MVQTDTTIRGLSDKQSTYEELVDGPNGRLYWLRTNEKLIEMAKLHRKLVPPADVPPMSEFELDEVVSIFMGVKPRSEQKPQKQKTSKKSKKFI